MRVFLGFLDDGILSNCHSSARNRPVRHDDTRGKVACPTIKNIPHTGRQRRYKLPRSCVLARGSPCRALAQSSKTRQPAIRHIPWNCHATIGAPRVDRHNKQNSGNRNPKSTDRSNCRPVLWAGLTSIETDQTTLNMQLGSFEELLSDSRFSLRERNVLSRSERRQ